MYSWSNFYYLTIADWARCEIPDREPDYVSFSGSCYWNYDDCVIRLSNHWGKSISTCCWYIEYQEINGSCSICGKCYYEDFRGR